MIVRTMASVKQTLLDSKSREAFGFKQGDLVQKPQVGNYYMGSTKFTLFDAVTSLHVIIELGAQSWILEVKGRR